MTKYKVVLGAFPFDDLSGIKVRPAVCLTDRIGPLRHVVLAFVTSRVTDKPLPSDLVRAARACSVCRAGFSSLKRRNICYTYAKRALVLDASDPDFSATGLRVSSTLQLHRLMTATTSLIRRELGELTPRLQAEIQLRLRKLFDLNKP